MSKNTLRSLKPGRDFSFDEIPASVEPRSHLTPKKNVLHAQRVQNIVDEVRSTLNRIYDQVITHDELEAERSHLSSILDSLSTICIQATPTEMKDMVDHWEVRNPEIWKDPIQYGTDDLDRPLEEYLDRKNFLHLPPSKNAIVRDDEVIQPAVMEREKAVLWMLGRLHVSEIVRAFNTNILTLIRSRPDEPTPSELPPIPQNLGSRA